jgi:hypothetical protein
MIQPLTMEQLKEAIGKEIIKGDWIEITQETITKFADCTNDHQWIHVDAAKAEKGPFGTTIAHGFLVLSLMAKCILDQGVSPAGSKMLVNYGLNRLRFILILYSSAQRSGCSVRWRALRKRAKAEFYLQSRQQWKSRVRTSLHSLPTFL